VIVTGVFVVLGGMKSVLWTEAMHVPVLLAGSAVLLIVGLHEIGGMDALKAANPETLHLWRPLSTSPETQGFPGFLFDKSETPWLGVLLCSPIIGLWYWCTDQYIVQRVLSARGLKEARRGTIFAGYLKLAPVFIFLIPGMIAVALYKQNYPGFESIGTNPQGAFPVLVSNLLPAGLRGLVLAGMLSALMSALASLFNSTATLFTVDFLQAHAAAGERAASREGGATRDRGRDRDRHALDSDHAQHGRPAVFLSAGGAVAARARHRCRVHARHLLAPRDAKLRSRRARVRLCHGDVATRPTGDAQLVRCRFARIPAGDRRHQLVVLQLHPVRADVPRDLCRQHGDAEGVASAACRADVPVRDRRPE
jgi:hypothetical protein